MIVSGLGKMVGIFFRISFLCLLSGSDRSLLKTIIRDFHSIKSIQFKMDHVVGSVPILFGKLKIY